MKKVFQFIIISPIHLPPLHTRDDTSTPLIQTNIVQLQTWRFWTASARAPPPLDRPPRRLVKGRHLRNCQGRHHPPPHHKADQSSANVHRRRTLAGNPAAIGDVDARTSKRQTLVRRPNRQVFRICAIKTQCDEPFGFELFAARALTL